MKTTDHRRVYGSVHPRAERKLYGAQRLRWARRLVLDAGKNRLLEDDVRTHDARVQKPHELGKGEFMSITNKPPERVKREYELQDPVAQAVEKYALFIQSTPDHAVNSALKMVVWKDAEFRRWRKQQQSNPERKEGTATAAKA